MPTTNSEQILRALLAAHDDRVTMLSLDGSVLAFVGADGELGRNAETAVEGTAWIERWPESDRVAARDAVATAAAGNAGHFQSSPPTPGNASPWWDVVITPIRGPEGHPVRLLAIARDITRQKRLETELGSFARLASFAGAVGTALVERDSLPGMLKACAGAMVVHLDAALARIWTVDEAGTTLRLQASAGMYTHLDGQHARIAVGQFKIGLIAQERLPHLTNEVIGDPRVPQQAWAREHGLTAFAGYPLLVDDNLVGVMAMFARRSLGASTLAAMESVAHSVAVGIERKRTELALRRSRARLQEESTLTETLNQVGTTVAAELDRDKVVQAVTDAATTLTGANFGAFFYNVTESSGESYLLYALSGVPRAAFEGFPNPRNTPIFAPTFRGEGPVRLDDVTRDPRFGQNPPHHGMPAGHLPVRSYLAVPVTSSSGQVLGGLFFGHPQPAMFTERHERLATGVAGWAALALDNAILYQTARDANRLKDEFLATLSHELRTPLNAILGWTHMLRSGAAGGPADQTQALESIERNAQAQAQLIEDLLDVSRIISGRLELDEDPVNLTGALTDAVDALRPVASAKRVSVVTDIRAETTVTGDVARLKQVFWNLLSNAVNFTDTGGQVAVVLDRDGDRARVEVRDTGCGIPAGALPFVFDRFRQADGSTQRRRGGLGLGLAIVKGFTEAQGGTVAVESTEGAGSRFTVWFPLTESGPTKPAGGERPAARVQLSETQVLVVDDDDDARDLARIALEAAGAQVAVAGSTREALALIEQETPDVLVADIGMPDIDGYGLMKAIRERERQEGGPRLPAVAVTAYASVADRERALTVGFDAHLPKPIDLSQLTAVVGDLVGQRTSPSDSVR